MNGDTGEIDLIEWAQRAEAVASVARMLATTSFVPDQIKVWEHMEFARDPNRRGALVLDSTVAQVTAVILAGSELRFKPMASLRAFTMIRGQVAMYAIAARGLLLNAGHEIVIKETTSARAIVLGRRAGSEHWQESRWDIERARIAGLYPGPDRGNWKTQTQAMLVARATAEASRWVAADAMMGLPVMVEELEGGDAAQNGQAPLALEAGAAPPAPKPQRRRPASSARAALPAGPPAPPPADPVPPETQPTRPKLARSQQTRLFAAFRAIGMTEKDEALAMIRAWVVRGPDEPQIGSSSDLTGAEASAVIERAEAIKKVARSGNGAVTTEPEEGPGGLDEEPDAG